MRYLDALAHAHPQGKALAGLDDLCRSRVVDTKRYAKFNPVATADCQLFAATMADEHALHGFRNKDLRVQLYATPAASADEARRRSAHVSRLIAKRHGHGLIAKVNDSRLYRVTARGYRLMAATLHCRNKEFPGFVLQAA